MATTLDQIIPPKSPRRGWIILSTARVFKSVLFKLGVIGTLVACCLLAAVVIINGGRPARQSLLLVSGRANHYSYAFTTASGPSGLTQSISQADGLMGANSAGDTLRQFSSAYYSVEFVTRIAPAGVVFDTVKISDGDQSATFVSDEPQILLPAPGTLTSWTWHMSTTDGLETLTASLSSAQTVTTTEDGTNVSTTTVSGPVTTSGLASSITSLSMSMANDPSDEIIAFAQAGAYGGSPFSSNGVLMSASELKAVSSRVG
jgi:hypothetical protein